MKKVIAIYFFLMIANCSFAQSSNWLWARSAVGNSSNEGTAICYDSEGNLYETGVFFDSLVSFSNFTLINSSWNSTNPGCDIFIVKYDVYGNVIWAKSAGGTGVDVPAEICCDHQGNIILTGEFHYERSIVFGNDTLTNTDTSGFYADVFIAKYDSLGNVLWAASPAGIEGEQSFSVATDANGNIFVTGEFHSPTIFFGSLVLTNVAYGAGDIFIAKYDPLGNVIWAHSAGGSYQDDGSSICVDFNGDVIVTGVFSSPIISFGSTSLINSFSGLAYGIFLVKYNSAGSIIWAKSPSGWEIFPYPVLTSDISGNIYLTGGFDSPTLTFDAYQLTNHSWNTDIFIAKYDPLGNVAWARSVGTASGEEVGAISYDFAGNIYLLGGFRDSTLTFDTITISAPIFSFPSFIAKYDIYGNALCASVLPGGAGMGGLTSDNFGNAYVTGSYNTDPFIIGQDTLMLSGQQNEFIAKYSCSVSSEGISINNKSSAQIYPNPSNGNFTFVFQEETKSNLKIYNSFGEIIESIEISGKTATINLSDKPNGIYYYQLMNEGGHEFYASGKLSIEK